MIVKKNNVVVLLSIVGMLLFVPLIAMQFTNEVDWDFPDFLIAAILMFVLGFSLINVWRRIKSRNLRVFFSIGVLLLFLLIWAELAVGLFNSPLAGN